MVRLKPCNRSTGGDGPAVNLSTQEMLFGRVRGDSFIELTKIRQFSLRRIELTMFCLDCTLGTHAVWAPQFNPFILSFCFCTVCMIELAVNTTLSVCTFFYLLSKVKLWAGHFPSRLWYEETRLKLSSQL